MKKMKPVLIAVLIWIVLVAGSYYLMLPAINIHNPGSWWYIMILLIIGISEALFLRWSRDGKPKIKNYKHASKMKAVFSDSKVVMGIVACVAAVFVLFLLTSIYGAQIFHAKRYSEILEINDVEFADDLDEASGVSKIALMDSQSARILGDREIGGLTEVVSQFSVDYYYSQIDYNGSPIKVAALHYDDFFKYLGNFNEGTPGYVKVDPVKQKASYVPVKEGMKYIPSSHFSKLLYRHLRFAYPTKIFENVHFEVDEEGNPYYIASVIGYEIGLFGGKTVTGAIVCDPVTGDTNYYDLEDVPQWVDGVYDGDLLVEQFNWYGLLHNGFFNSIFSKKGCRKCTETAHVAANSSTAEASVTSDYGYVAKDGDIWIYTGVTSVNDDASNIGFIMVNERTGEAHYYTIAGADENSAMAAAEGEVQEKRYTASFPSLINVDSNATYIMVLKDNNNIVKLYAMVNVEQYNLVTTSSNLDTCFEQYREMLLGANVGTDKAADVTEEVDAASRTFTVAKVQYIVNDGETYVYVLSIDGKIYKEQFTENEDLIKIGEGDTVTVDCKEVATDTYQMSGEIKVVPSE